jgi:hypothetical protein
MIHKNFTTMIAACLLIGISGVVSAASPTTVNNSQPNNNSGVSTTVLSGTGLSSAASTSGAVSNFAFGGGGGQNASLDVKRFALSGTTGAAAAPGATQWNAWGAFSRSNIGYEFSPLRSSGNVNVYLAGADYTFANNMVFGVALAFDRTDVDLNFSGGKFKGSGVTVAPYLGIPINRNLAVDATIGYGQTDIDTVVGAVTGSTRSDRNVGSLGITYREVIDAWSLSARGVFLTVRDKLGAYTLSNGTFVPDGTVNVSQFRFQGQVAYSFGAVTPYASLTYVNDVRRPDQAPVAGVAAANDRDAWIPSVGLRFRLDNSVYGGIQYSTERARSEVKNDQIMLNLGVRF